MISNVALYDLFDYAELSSNMRQQDEEQFAALLLRMRVQSMEEADWKVNCA